MGDNRIYVKNYAPLSFKMIFRMNLISAGSISLEGTFQYINLLWIEDNRWLKMLCYH
jgi:hypothetical protein